MKKMMGTWLLVLFLLACGGDNGELPTTPEPPLPQAEITIASSVNPIVFVWDALTLGYVGACTFTISETNGVGCDISTIEVAFYLGGQTYAPVTQQGGRINANNSASIDYAGWIGVSIYPQIRVLVSGSDDNDYTISTSQLFNIVFY